MPDIDTSAKSKGEAASAMAGAMAAPAGASREAAAEGSKSGMNRLLIVVVLASIALAAAGVGGLWWMSREPVEAVAAPEPPPEPTQFLKIDAMTISLRRQDGTVAPLTVVVSLDLTGGIGAAAAATQQIPRLRDAFLRALTLPPLRARAEDGRASMEEVKGRLLAASRAVLGADAVRDVLIQATAG